MDSSIKTNILPFVPCIWYVFHDRLISPLGVSIRTPDHWESFWPHPHIGVGFWSKLVATVIGLATPSVGIASDKCFTLTPLSTGSTAGVFGELVSQRGKHGYHKNVFPPLTWFSLYIK